PPSRKVEVDVRFDEIVLRALENDPGRRYQHASEVKSRVQTIADSSTSATAVAEPIQRMVHWADFPVAVERDGNHQIHWKGAFLAFAVIFGLLTLAFGFVSALTGRSIMGWIGVIGWPSVVARLLIAAVIVAVGVFETLRRPLTSRGTTILTRKRPWWRSRGVVVSAIGLVLITWIFFQERWLAARALEKMQALASFVPISSQPADPAPSGWWTPTVKPGELPDPGAILNEAKQLMQAEKYEEALQRHIWYHNHALEIKPSLSGVRLSFALANWVELGRRYPRAKQALVEIRDQKTRAIDEGRGYSHLF